MARPRTIAFALLDQHVHAIVQRLGHAHPAVELEVFLFGGGFGTRGGRHLGRPH
jgi:hypothetical protein